jgi:hypothetical protein
MTTFSPSSASSHRCDVRVRTALTTGAVAAAIAAIVNMVISAIARGPLGVGDDFVPLTPGPVVMWTILGVMIGAVGWRAIVNAAARSRALLTALVPTVLVFSLLPDVALLITDATPGQTTAGVVTLMVMHVVTAVVSVTAFRRAMPAS